MVFVRDLMLFRDLVSRYLNCHHFHSCFLLFSNFFLLSLLFQSFYIQFDILIDKWKNYFQFGKLRWTKKKRSKLWRLNYYKRQKKIYININNQCDFMQWNHNSLCNRLLLSIKTKRGRWKCNYVFRFLQKWK